MRPDVSVVVVAWNSAAVLAQCLERVVSPGGRLVTEVVVVDCASDDDSVDVAEGCPGVTVVALPHNVGYARANNLALAHTMAPWVLFLNPDVVLERGAVAALAAHLEAHADVVGVGPTLWGVDGTPQFSPRLDAELGQSLATMTRVGRLIDRRRGWPVRRARTYEDDLRASPDVLDVEVPITACLLVAREDLPDPPFDEQFPLHYNDGDLCRRLRADGRRFQLLRGVSATHVGGHSTSQAPPARVRAEFLASLIRYADRWWNPVEAATLRALLVVDALVSLLWDRARRRETSVEVRGQLGALGLPGGSKPWLGPPASRLPKRPGGRS